MEHQKTESSGIKTHDEIMALFKALESMEMKVKNPDMFIEELFEKEASLQEVELPPQILTKTAAEQQLYESHGEMSLKKKEKRKKSLVFAHQPKELPEAGIKKRFSLWKKVKIGELDSDTIVDSHENLQPVTQLRSTFSLHINEEGNLVGFPLKKPVPSKEKRGWFFFRRKSESEQSEETPAKGIKEKLLRVVSRFKRKKSSEGESSGGIGGKIRGLLKRKPKE